MKLCRYYILCLMILGCGGLVGCRRSRYASGTLTIDYSINKVEDVVPSHQTVVWLEDAAGSIVATLMVSDYLSTGGYKKEGICPAWSEKANWATKKQADIAAVTRPTPEIGKHTLKVDCHKQKLKPGVYRYFVQTHIVKDYNILYSGEILIGGMRCANVAKVSWTPKESDKGSTALGEVKARYY